MTCQSRESKPRLVPKLSNILELLSCRTSSFNAHAAKLYAIEDSDNVVGNHQRPFTAHLTSRFDR